MPKLVKKLKRDLVINEVAVVSTISKQNGRLLIFIPKRAENFLTHRQKVIIKPFNYKEKRVNR